MVRSRFWMVKCPPECLSIKIDGISHIDSYIPCYIFVTGLILVMFVAHSKAYDLVQEAGSGSLSFQLTGRNTGGNNHWHTIFGSAMAMNHKLRQNIVLGISSFELEAHEECKASEYWVFIKHLSIRPKTFAMTVGSIHAIDFGSKILHLSCSY